MLLIVIVDDLKIFQQFSVEIMGVQNMMVNIVESIILYVRGGVMYQFFNLVMYFGCSFVGKGYCYY